MKILVTGGAGFIGANFLCDRVTNCPNDQFLNLDVLSYSANLANLATIENSPNYGFTQGDLADFDATLATVREFQPDWVFHFAAESHVDRSILGPLQFVRSNVLGTANLLEACRQVWSNDSGKMFLHVSTDEVFGSLEDTGTFNEATAYDPSSPYSATKASSDHLVRAYHRTYGLPVKITNCSNNYGPFQFPEKLVPLMTLNATKGAKLPVYGTGSNIRDWLYVGDHCNALWTVATRGQIGQTYCIGGRSERTNLEIVQLICEYVAEFTGTNTQSKLDLIEFVRDRPGHDFRYAIDTTKISQELGWQPSHSLETGLRSTVKWYLDHPQWVESVLDGSYKEWMKANYEGRASGVSGETSRQ